MVLLSIGQKYCKKDRTNASESSEGQSQADRSAPFAGATYLTGIPIDTVAVDGIPLSGANLYVPRRSETNVSSQTVGKLEWHGED